MPSSPMPLPLTESIPVLPKFQGEEDKENQKARTGPSAGVGAGSDLNDGRVFKQMIRAMNLKVTGQRLAILQALHGGRSHITAQEVYEVISVRDPEIGFATVYRFLRTLTEHGFVTEVRMGGLPARYELTPKSHHDHITCIQCGKICEFSNTEIEKLQERMAVQFGFVLTSHVLELYGVCSQCQARKD